MLNIVKSLQMGEAKTMNRLIRGVLGIAVAFAASLAVAGQASANSKYAAYVVHAESGDVFFDRYSTKRRYPASLTKMMTLYLLFEALEDGELTLTSKLPVSKRAAGQPPSKLGVRSGNTIPVEAAIHALVVKSANDVAVVVAEKLAGSEWRFAQEMTTKARSLGMYRTVFRNASGLPNTKQITTARDMAILGQRVQQDFPQYFHYFSTKKFTYGGRTYSTHNSLVKTYAGADGIKTGYTNRSGYNLVTTADKNGNRLIGVVLGGRSGYTRDRHMRQILNNAFAAIAKNPRRVSALHRNTPTPSIKPTALAALAKKKQAVALAAAPTPSVKPAPSASDDVLGALIAAADTDDFNEFESYRMARASRAIDYLGEGDRDSEDDGLNWDVQIGAYSSKTLAQKELERAVKRGGLSDSARSVSPSRQDSGQTLFRARLTSLTEIEAAATCAHLQDKGVSCFVVPHIAPQYN
ncbi:MAG: D-alanyl-D-alanine carboxypeptidase [Pseudomonadota bacterium]